MALMDAITGKGRTNIVFWHSKHTNTPIGYNKNECGNTKWKENEFIEPENKIANRGR